MGIGKEAPPGAAPPNKTHRAAGILGTQAPYLQFLSTLDPLKPTSWAATRAHGAHTNRWPNKSNRRIQCEYARRIWTHPVEDRERAPSTC
jgi:hypothetical protein